MKESLKIALLIDADNASHKAYEHVRKDLARHGEIVMTSDSDSTPLAIRIREDGIPVFGYGKSTTPKGFIDAEGSHQSNRQTMMTGPDYPKSALI